MQKNVLLRILKLLQKVRIKATLALVQLQYGTEGFPRDFQIAAGVRFSVTDGGTVSFGCGCSIDRHATVTAKRGSLIVGKNVYVGTGVVIVARHSIFIGDDVLIAEHVSIRDQDHAFGGAQPTNVSGFHTAPIVIGSNVWLGAKTTVTRGVTIGNNVVVGANSVVTHDLPDNCVAVGAPARVVRHLKAD